MARKLAYAQMTASMLLIGSMFVVSKVIVAHIPVMTASFFRQFLACLALVAVLLWRNRYDEKVVCPPINKRDQWILFIQIFCGIFLFSLLLLWGVQRTNAIDASIITSATPLSMMLFGVVFLSERMTWLRGVALICALAGALVMNVYGAQAHAGTTNNASNVWLGNLLIAGAVLFEGVFFGAQKLLSRPLPSIWLMVILTAGASVLFTPFALYDALIFDFSHVPLYVWGLVVYTGVCITAFGVLLMHAGIKQVPNSSASVFTALMPVSGVVLSVLLLNESFQWYHLLGMILVMMGMGLIVGEKEK
ncbi:MAG: eamA-like transporter family protein [Burkholderiaceae bacterium]|nr:eamA-like transporter family protein [Burkholderiaceae bacterium]